MYTRTFGHNSIRPSMPAHTHTPTPHPPTHTHKDMHACAHAHTCMHTHAHTHTHTHTHISYLPVIDTEFNNTVLQLCFLTISLFQPMIPQQRLTAQLVGNFSAWLWAYDETKRKCGRSWSCAVRLMELYPDFRFTCSQVITD